MTNKLRIFALFGSLAALLNGQYTPPSSGGGGGGSGTVTAVTVAGTANQIGTTGTCTSTTVVNCTFAFPSVVIMPGTASAQSFTSTGTSAGTISLTANSTPGSILANSFGFMAPSAISTAEYLQPPNAVPAANSVMLIGAPSGNISTFVYTNTPTLTGTNFSGIPPGAVTSAQGNGTKFQFAGTISGTGAALCTDAGGNTTTSGCPSGSGGGASGWSGITLSLLATGTQYTAPVGGALTSATETIVSLPASAGATISGLSVTLSASLGTGTTLTVTLEDGTATPTALTCVTASAGTSCTDTTHSVNVAKGDLLAFKIVASGTVTAATPQLEIGYAVGTSGVGVTSTSFTGGLISVASPTTTPALTVAGTSGGVPYFSSSTTWASSGALGSGQIVFGGGAGATPTSGNLSGDVTTSGSAATTIATKYKIFLCEPGLGDGLNALAAGTYLQSNCINEFGATYAITGIWCYTDNAGSSTMSVTNGAGTALLSGAITCSNTLPGAAGTQSATTTIVNGDGMKFTFIGDGTSKQTTWVVAGTR